MGLEFTTTRTFAMFDHQHKTLSADFLKLGTFPLSVIAQPSKSPFPRSPHLRH